MSPLLRFGPRIIAGLVAFLSITITSAIAEPPLQNIPITAGAFEPACPKFEIARTSYFLSSDPASQEALRVRVERNFHADAAKFLPEITAVQPFALRVSAAGKADHVIGDIFHFSSIPFAWEAGHAIRKRIAGFDPSFAPHVRLVRSREVLAIIIRPHPDQFPLGEKGLYDSCFDRIQDYIGSKAAERSKKETEPTRETRPVAEFIRDNSFDSLLVDALTDDSLDALKQYPNLDTIALTGDRITVDGYRKLDVLTAARTVSLGPGRVTDAGLDGVMTMRNLKKLMAGYCRITDKGLSRLQGLTSLEELSLRGNEITGSGFNHLSQMKNLHTLGLNWNPVNDRGLTALPVLPALETIFLADTDVTDEGLPALVKQPKLRYLVLRKTGVSDAGIPALAKLSALEAVDVIHTKVTPAGVAELQRVRPGLIVLTAGSSKEERAALAALEQRIQAGHRQ